MVPLDDDAARLADHRKVCQDCEVKGWGPLDGMLFKISGGGLALSLTLLGVTKNVNPASMRWLFAAWICWGIALLAVPLSMLTGQLGLRSQIAHIDAGDYRRTKNPQGIGAWTPALNAIAICGSTLGQVFLVWFALLNLSGRIPTVADEKSPTLRTGGQVAPQAPTPAAATKVMIPSETRGQVAPQVAPISIAPITPVGGGQVAPQAPPPAPATGTGHKKD